MPYLLRAVRNRTMWDRTQMPPWVDQDDLPSCIVNDLNADENTLSVWEIPDDKRNLSQVITAIASAGAGSKEYFDYALLKVDLIDDLNFSLTKEDGKTPYADANQFHRNLSDLSLHKLVYFAHLLCKDGHFGRTPWKEVRQSLLAAHSDGKLDSKRLRNGLKLDLLISELPKNPKKP